MAIVTIRSGEPLRGFDGEPFKDKSTVGDILMTMLGQHRAPNGKEAVQAYDVAGRFYAASKNGGEVELESAEFELVEKIAEANAIGANVAVMGMVYKEIKEAKAASENGGKRKAKEPPPLPASGPEAPPAELDDAGREG